MKLVQILAATDFSARAMQAVERAAILAQQHQASLHLIHVIPTLSWKMFGRILFDHPLVTEKHLYDAAAAHLQQVASELKQRYAVTVQTYVEIGRAHDKIAAYARRHGIDLTVMGAHAENAARDLFVGSTALKFLHTGTHPVLIVRSASDLAYRRVLVPVDFSSISRTAIETALDFAPQASICVLHVYDVFFEGKMQYAGVDDKVIQQYRNAAQIEAGERMDSFLAGFDRRASLLPIVRHGPTARTILAEARTLEIDLLVMGKRGSAELDHLLLGSVTENVLIDLDRDMLMVGEQ